ncbi:hypothetical protein [uncultured Salinicola sp.]|uniref:type II secretion system protein n=1 Tax=uncultured Salinicola sp. TaxID=1193542 RepID=UPI0026231098|nr:hypothetical protein [uncultured Salinicola sp.]|tara:strand:+ start:2183 stop:3532 length:1350 start_codon:yes stop_codon:yes gene_type:complete
MTTITLVILGVLLAAASVLFILYYGGDAFGNGRIEAEAGRLVGEGAQMEAALELYYRQEGHYPTSGDPVQELISAGYLDYQPIGTRTMEVDRWAIDYDGGMIRAKLGPTDHEESLNICLKARQQLDLPKANTATGVYRCDGSDSPDGRLGGREPCCIGEVATGGGPVDTGPQAPVRFTQPDICGAQPAANAAMNVRGTWLACYIRQVEAAADAWIDEGSGSFPSTKSLYDAGFLYSMPPSWPEISYIGVTRAWQRMHGAPDGSTIVIADFDGSAGIGAKGDLARAVTAADSGLPNSNYYVWHVYTQPIYNTSEGAPEGDIPLWTGPIPAGNASVLEKADYIAYWFRKNREAIDKWKADGMSGANITSIGALYATEYETAPGMAFTQDESLYIGTAWQRTWDGTPNLVWRSYYRNGDSTSLCSQIEARLYGQARCSSYSTYRHVAYKTHK